LKSSLHLFWDCLEAGGDRSALISETESLSYSGLVGRIECFTREVRSWLPESVPRPLVLLEATNEVESIVAYLACLRARWPVLLVAPGQGVPGSEIASTYAPNVVVRRDGAEVGARLACCEPAAMSADLAVLLSTSGTTGAAKLVRLSTENLQANATAISEYLGISSSERAMTALPFHYSYGMSVLHSHLRSHAALVLSGASLLDTSFWELARRHGATSLALVPTQFELLERLSFSKSQSLPTLRYITQAGGRLEPQLAADFARRAKAEGWQFFIMYGQTEASPRMSYVPPEDALQWGHSIGRAIPGGRFRLLDASGNPITSVGQPGELVFEGPNVMLGYALTRADLDAPPGPQLLSTGDVAERLDNGYFRITGRLSRFIKLFGHRISLDQVEAALREQGQRAYVSGSDERLVVFAVKCPDPGLLRLEIARRYEWPQSVVQVVDIEEAPLLPSGKVDYRELSRRAATLQAPADEALSSLQQLLQSALRQEHLDPQKNFLELGGDSLAYLEVQLFLSRKLGRSPKDWERLPLRELYALAGAHQQVAPTGWQEVPVDLIARNLSILAVMALHSTAWPTGGGSILLLILVGYSLARFQSELLFRGQVGKTLRAMLGKIVVAYYALTAFAALRFSPFDRGWFFLVENFRAEVSPSFLEPYWYVSTYAQIIAFASVPFAIPRVRELVRRAPFQSGMAGLLTAAATVQLTQVHEIFYGMRHRHPIVALELLLTGWCIFFAQSTSKKLLAAGAVLLVWLQNYGLVESNITILMLGGSLAMLSGWRVTLPPFLARALLFFGSLSMFVYLAHVPTVYELSSRVDSETLRFLATVIVSLSLAQLLKTLTDMLMARLPRIAALSG
jgi:acyl-CoA synthetase (AMP-forming)/AMP-acid ligase II